MLCVDAGVHGDEYDGQEAIRRVLAEIDPATLRGTVVGIPCLNTPAFEAAARASGIDHLNLNRIFPGDAEGSYSQRLAATFVEKVIPAVDAVVDLHTGGAYGEIAPLVILQGGYEDLATDIGARRRARAGLEGRQVGRHGPPPRPRGGQARHHHRVRRRHLPRGQRRAAHDSVRNILRSLGMIDGEAELRDTYTTVSGTFARSAAGGFFVAHAEPGETCKEGDLIATIVDHYGNTLEEVSAPQDGIVLWVRRIRTVHPGDEVVIFGEVAGGDPAMSGEPQLTELLIDGKQVPAADGRSFTVLDPSNGTAIAQVALAGKADVDQAVAAARAAFTSPEWAGMRAADRGRILYRIAEAIRYQGERLARLESQDVGKPLRQAKADVEAAARYFEFYAGVADKLGGTTIPLGPGPPRLHRP